MRSLLSSFFALGAILLTLPAHAQSISALSVNQNVAMGGQMLTAQLALSAPQPVNGLSTTFSLSPAVVVLSPLVSIQSGARSATFRIQTLPEPIHGHEGMRQFVTGLRTAFPDLKFTIDRECADGDKVATRWYIAGTHLGSFLGAPPSNNKIKDQGIDIFRIRDGKIAEVWVNENDLGLMQQMGVIPGGEKR